MYRYGLLVLGMGMALTIGCSDTDDGGGSLSCKNHSECGEGSLCNKEGRCESSLSNKHGVTDTEVVFGNSSSIKTGTSQNLSIGITNGIMAYFDYINSIGGVHGRTLRLDARDDGYDPARAVENVKAMVEPKNGSREVFGLAGNMGSPTSAQTMPIAITNRTLFYAALSGAPHLRGDEAGRYVFNFRASYAEQAQDLSRYFMTKREPRSIHARNIFVFAQGEDDSGQDGCTYPTDGSSARKCDDDPNNQKHDVMDAFGGAGFEGVGNVLTQAPYNIARHEIPFATHTRNKTDLTAGVLHLLKWLGRPKATNETYERDGARRFDAAIVMQLVDVPAAALVTTVTDEIANIRGNGPSSDYDELTTEEQDNIKLLGTLEFGATVIAQTFLDDLLAKGADKYCSNVLASQIVPHPQTSNAEVVIDFREHMTEFRKDETQDVYALEGYIAAKILAEALNRLGRDISTEALIDTMESMGNIDVGLGEPLGFSPNDHQASHTTWAQQITKTCTWQAFDMKL